MSKKQKVLIALFEFCKANRDFQFDNEKVKEVCKTIGFGNPFDVTKVDNSRLLPKEIKDEGYCVVHLGEGRHCFMPIMDDWYHKFEGFDNSEKKDWKYKPSILNHTDKSESNVISLAL